MILKLDNSTLNQNLENKGNRNLVDLMKKRFSYFQIIDMAKKKNTE